MKKSKLISFLLLVLYMGYFAGVNFFVHSHMVQNHLVVHSHPYASKNHNHSDKAIQLVDLLQDYTSTEPVHVDAPHCAVIDLLVEASALPLEHIVASSGLYSQLRAPPVA